MKKLFTYFLSAIMIVAVGCSESFDDSLIWEEINSLKDRVTTLEQLCKQMNTNISSLQTIVTALQNNDYVTNISPITEDGKTIGYTITFSKSGSVTIYHGKDGKDGYTPVIGVAKDADGLYYWTLDGEWLLDKDSNKVKANGVDGKDGIDGVTPKLKIEEGYWYISHDDGSIWTQLDKATGEDGDSMFETVTYDSYYIYITLTDGTKLTIPREPPVPNNEIWYTTSDGQIVALSTDTFNEFGAYSVSNVYEDGKGVITFNGDITSIGWRAFYQRSNLTSIIIPNSVTSINYYAFEDCDSLTSITIPDSIISIGESAFVRCESLTNINIPESVISIGRSAFSGCSSLTNITIPNGVTEIKDGTFSGCSSLTNVTISNGVTKIDTSAFSGCSSLISVTIPNSITSIGNYAFSGCSNLTSVTIPDSVTEIRTHAFAECRSLTSVTILDGVNHIGERAFFLCKSLTSVTIPESVTEIGKEAFFYCYSLASVYCKPTTPPALSRNDVFHSTAYGLKIYVPTASVAAYKVAVGWLDYASIIRGYDF